MIPSDSKDLESTRTALEESLAKGTALFDTSPGAILTIDDAGKIVEANPAAEEMFGFRAEEVRGLPMVELVVPPEFREAHTTAFQRVVAGEASNLLGRRARLVAQRVDGTRFPVELAIARIDIGPRTHFTGFVTDLTQRSRYEEALREQQAMTAFERDIGITVSSSSGIAEMLQECAEHAVQHLGASFARIWTLEEDGRVLHLRASAGKYTHLDGLHSRVPVGSFKIGMIAAEQQPHLTNDVIGDPHVHDQAWARENGMVAFAGYPLLVEGRTVGVMAMFATHELSPSTMAALGAVANPIAIGVERKRIEAELLEAAEALLRADQRKNEFLAMLGHELRSPIQVAKNCVSLLREKSGDSSPEELATIDSQMHQVARLVEDILDLSRIMRGEVSLVERDLCLATVVRNALDSLRSLVTARGQEIALESPDGEPLFVRGDEVRLLQVLTNLVNNASKYSDDGSCIRVVLAADGDQEVILRVADEGIGIDPSFMPEIFDMFTRANPDVDRGGQGLGVGLSLTKRIVEQHGGSIEIHSEGVGEGATVTVRLPRVQGHTPTEPEVPAGSNGRSPSGRVLVVDDNEDAAQSLARLAEVLGASAVEVAHEGRAALASFDRFEPDLVLLDLGLPGMDGCEVARRMRAAAGPRRTTLVAVTGHDGAEVREETRAAGFDRHIVKPLDRSDLEDLLRA